MGTAHALTVRPIGNPGTSLVRPAPTTPLRPTPDLAPARHERLALGATLREVAEQTRGWWHEAGTLLGRPISLTVDAPDELAIEAPADVVRSALSTLVLSAVDTLTYGGAIRLSARRRADSIDIDVVSLGLGLARPAPTHPLAQGFAGAGKAAPQPALALTVVGGLVQRAGGTLTVQAVPGRGSRVRLTFAAPSATVCAITASGAARPRRILAVDDVQPLGEAVANILRADGHTVVVATSAEAAIEHLSTQPFDLVISDLGLGAGLSGWDLADITRSRFPGTAFVLMTGWEAQIEPEEALAHGIKAVVAKPCRAQHLRQLVATFAPGPVC